MVIKHVNKSVEDPHLKNLYPTKEEMTDPDPIFENKSEFRSITLVDIKVKYLLRILYFFFTVSISFLGVLLLIYAL